MFEEEQNKNVWHLKNFGGIKDKFINCGSSIYLYIQWRQADSMSQRKAITSEEWRSRQIIISKKPCDSFLYIAKFSTWIISLFCMEETADKANYINASAPSTH